MISTISNSQSLSDAIAAAHAGDTILLAPGVYDAFSLHGVEFAADVTIGSADQAQLAVLTGFTLDSVHGLRFEQLDMRVSVGKGDEPYEIRNSQNITLDHIVMHGSLDGDPQNDEPGLSIRNSSGVTVTNSEFEQLISGIAHLDSDHLVLTDNSIHDIQLDGIRGGGSSNVLIARNTFTDFYPTKSDHPDAIQFWTTNTSVSAHDITVIDNKFLRGAGEQIQGVFIRDEHDRLPFQNVTISGNLIVGGRYNGVFVDGAKNVTITDNIVSGFTDMKSYFWITNVQGATITGNTANSFSLHNHVSDLVDSDNTVIPLSSDGGAEAIATWNGLHGGEEPVSASNKGTAGLDTMTGGTGNDEFYVTTGDVVIEQPLGGVDTVISGETYGLPANVENLILTGGRWASAYGNELDNELTGSATPNTLSGKGGADTLNGGAGDDTLQGGAGNDRIIGGAGADVIVFERGGGHDVISDFGLRGEADALDLSALLKAGLTPTLTEVGADLKIAFGDDDILILGGRIDDLTATATGYVFNRGDDTAPATNEGTAGVDTLTGGAGDDVFTVTPGDVIVEGPDGGIDTVYSAQNYGVTDNVENIVLTGGRWAGAYGNELDNELIGSKTPNVLKGKAGEDTLDGGAGADTLHGGEGDDMIIGGLGADIIVFEHGGGRDVVVDFGFGGEADRLDLTDFLRGGEAPTLTEVGADVWIAFGEDEIVLLDTRIADLTATPTGYVFG